VVIGIVWGVVKFGSVPPMKSKKAQAISTVGNHDNGIISYTQQLSHEAIGGKESVN